MRNYAYFDNAGASIMPQLVQDRMKQHIDLESALGGYIAQGRVADELEGVYQKLALLFGGTAADYGLFTGSAEAWGRLFYSIPLVRGDVVVIAYNEYCSNYSALHHRVERDGIILHVVEALSDGSVDLAAFETALNLPNVKLLALSAVPSSTGQVMPVRNIGAMAKQAGVPFLLDGAQAFGHVAMNVDEIGCDMAVGTSRKFLRGPRGVGFFYIAPEMRPRLSPVMRTNNSGPWVATNSFDLRTDARLMEAWERDVAAQLGFGVALQALLDARQDRLYNDLSEIAVELRQRIYALPHITPACPPDAVGAIITFNVAGFAATEVQSLLAKQNVIVQVASVQHTRLDLQRRGIESSVRVSPHIYTTAEACDALLIALDDLAHG